MRFDNGLRIDLLVNELVIVVLKSAELLAPVHYKQVLTCLNLMDLSVGLLIKIGAPLIKQGIRPIVN